jgi:uncharacterized membrane protein YcaP (DUF421 family)
MFFHSWSSVLRIVVIATGTYVLIVGLLRLLGEQALAKMSAYDLVVTVALGSLLASIPLGSGITLVDGLAAIGTYLLLQQILRWAVKHSKRTERLVRDIPQFMVWDGQFLDQQLKDHNVLKAEIRAAVRRAGLGSISEALAVILENDGDWSVLPYHEDSDYSALEGLELPWPVPRRATADSRSGGHALPVTTTSGTI